MSRSTSVISQERPAKISRKYNVPGVSLLRLTSAITRKSPVQVPSLRPGKNGLFRHRSGDGKDCKSRGARRHQDVGRIIGQSDYYYL
eukprot:245658-Amorphochlora_amoeboformis.AAC.1